MDISELMGYLVVDDEAIIPRSRSGSIIVGGSEDRPTWWQRAAFASQVNRPNRNRWVSGPDGAVVL